MLLWAVLRGQGVTDAGFVQAYKDKLSDALWVTRIDLLLYSQPVLADALFRANEKEIKSPEVKQVLQAKTREVAQAVSVTIEAQRIIDDVRALPTKGGLMPGADRGKTLRDIESGLAKDPNNPELIQAKYVVENEVDAGPSTSGLRTRATWRLNCCSR